MKLIVTGAGGFVGAALVERLLSRGRVADHLEPFTSLLTIDALPHANADPRVTAIVGSLADQHVRDALLADPVDTVFHLAAVPGGAAALDYALGWSVNVEASVALFEALARQRRPARLVQASSIAVFGIPLPTDVVDDNTLPLPTMSYGAQKLIVETLLADFSRRGLIDGVAVRLPGIVARPPVKGGHLTAYMSNVFHALAAGEAIELPVSANATAWFMSRQRCVDNLLHAAALPSEHIDRRTFNLPALRLSTAELIDGIAAHFGPQVRDRVRFAPNAGLQAQFGSYPLLHTPHADRLGFTHDGDAIELAGRALNLTPYLRS